MSRELRFKANAKQKAALKILRDKVHSSVGYGGGGGGGKSFIGVFWCWDQCWQFPGVRYFFGRNELKNIKKTTLVSYYEFCTKYDIPESQQGKFIDDESRIEFDNGSTILLLDLKYKPSDPLIKDLGSLLLTGGFVDESNEVDMRVIEILHTRVGRWMNSEYDIHPKILETFNPSKDHVYHRFYKPQKNGTQKPNVIFIKALALDWLIHLDYFNEHNEVHPDERYTWYGIYIHQLLQRDKITQERLLFGNFEYDDDPNSLIEYDSIVDCFSNTFVARSGKRYITADIALEGSDWLRIGVWDGWVLIDKRNMDKSTSDQVIQVIESLKLLYGVPNSHITYDADGVGNYVGGFVKGAKPFVNNSVPLEVNGIKENYENLKTQCEYRTADMINDHAVYLQCITEQEDRTMIIEEMEQVKKLPGDGKLKVVPKSKVKSILGRSPDWWDMIKMRMIFDLQPPKKTQALQSGLA